MATFITPVSLTLPTAGSWGDIDVSANIPVGATGVILHYSDTRNFSDNFGLRKKGSTDDRTDAHYGLGQTTACIGVDSNRIFQFYTNNTTSKSLWLVGYFTSDAVFFDNAVDKTPATNNAWTDIDISSDTGTDTAIGAIFEIPKGGCFRKKGSTDDRFTGDDNHDFVLTGLDGSEIGQVYKASTQNVYLVGYVTNGMTFNTNATQYTIGVNNAFTDLSALPSGAIAGILEVEQASNFNNYGLRKNGYTGSEGVTNFSNPRKSYHIVECDTSQIVEAKTANSAQVSWYLTGYFTSLAATTSTSTTTTTTSTSTTSTSSSTSTSTTTTSTSTSRTTSTSTTSTSSSTSTTTSTTTTSTSTSRTTSTSTTSTSSSTSSTTSTSTTTTSTSTSSSTSITTSTSTTTTSTSTTTTVSTTTSTSSTTSTSTTLTVPYGIVVTKQAQAVGYYG